MSTKTDIEVEKFNEENKIKATKRALNFFQEVEPSDVKKLYNLFKPDFDLFQYAYEEFFHFKNKN